MWRWASRRMDGSTVATLLLGMAASKHKAQEYQVAVEEYKRGKDS
jgi:hypothetical protein